MEISTFSRNPSLRDDSGVALIQVVWVGALLGVMAYLIAQMMISADQTNLKLIRRNQNITYSAILSDQTTDKRTVKDLGTTPINIGAGADILYR